MSDHEIELFVPGRVCLFGEHSDWAAGYRRTNSEVGKGYTIICGTNQGLYAKLRPHDSLFVFTATDDHGVRKRIELPMEASELLRVAEKGGFWGYVAGVAFQILTHYHVRGLEIDNYRTDLPLKKGLSSSAAVCVLTARAFNRIYDLKMTTRGEMDIAYRGEITTPSRCGRMDQGCAYGNKPVLMTYDGDSITVDELEVARELHYVIVDLKATKNTVRILSDLNKAYPFADSEVSRGVQHYLGPVNARIVSGAVDALKEGDVSRLGELMGEAQRDFDRYLRPACLEELTAPVLHKVLSYPSIQKYISGGKGVGSQGDGSAQLLVATADAQERVVRILEGDLGLTCLRLTIPRTKKIRKAVVTAAGYGTRLFPMTKVVRKELMPVMDEDGVLKPLIVKHVEDLLAAGIEHVAIVIDPGEQELFEKLFHRTPDPAVYSKLSTENRRYSDLMDEMGRHVNFLCQGEKTGLGHAVLTAKEWAGGQPFLLVLGDHLFQTSGQKSCVEQMLQASAQVEGSLVGLGPTSADETHRFGCATGEWEKEGSVLNLSTIVEKPSSEYAADNLRVPGFEPGTYLSVFGIYVLMPEVFSDLESLLADSTPAGGELQLTYALERLRLRIGLRGQVVEGRKTDIGQPFEYAASFGRSSLRSGSTGVSTGRPAQTCEREGA